MHGDKRLLMSCMVQAQICCTSAPTPQNSELVYPCSDIHTVENKQEM
jgi:hypothetical protein